MEGRAGARADGGGVLHVHGRRRHTGLRRSWHLQLIRQQVHQDFVEPLPSKHVDAPPPSYLTEPGGAIGCQPARIVGRSPQHDVVQVQDVESIPCDERHRFCATPVSPAVFLADQNTKLGGATGLIDVEQLSVLDVYNILSTYLISGHFRLDR